MIPDGDFVSEIADVEGGPSVKITVRRTSLEASLSVILHPESWEDTRREDAVHIAVGRLKEGLGWELPERAFSAEIIFHNYFCGRDKPNIKQLEHKPSGIVSRGLRTRDMTGAEGRREENRLLEEFIFLLWEAGIRPQPQRVSVKRLGKPRWNEERRVQQNGSSPEAGTEDDHEISERSAKAP